ncbi:hypothetical protein BO71DRAFT_418964 [Aspergillus ellipticus CBS 707.79]|uniref:Derlin n=1 Tax=Aspergillus ellipticus CBS 707.79 TaxID=1448320 RepID=A0A319E312_9EURO|nr:hypothetical protein BO71DRAFT_418964 [Aspergillus ellipticus CBS 707.79]
MVLPFYLVRRAWQQQQQQQQQRMPSLAALRAYSSVSKCLNGGLTARKLPLVFDYMHPQPSHLLNLTLCDLLPGLIPVPGDLPSVCTPPSLPTGHHLVYFPPQVSLSQLLPDGTDTLHAPGSPFNRRLWAGGRVRFPSTKSLCLDGSRAACLETIRDVTVTGQRGEEKVTVRIERRIGTVQEGEDDSSIRARLWKEDEEEAGHSSVIENRNLVFMREKTPDQCTHDNASFDKDRRVIKCKMGLVMSEIYYKNIAPLYAEEELAICGKPKQGKNHTAWDVWIEGRKGRLALSGSTRMDQFWAAPPVTRTLTLLTFFQSVLVHGGLISGYYVVFQRHLVFKALPEVWRLVSPFMITGPRLSLFLDLYFMFTYGSRLETLSSCFSAPGDFFTYVFFVASVIMVNNRGKKATFFIVQLPVEFLPWAMLALTLVTSGWPAALCDVTGIAAAHTYDFLTRIYPTFGGGRSYIVTPAWVRRYFATHISKSDPRVYGTAYHASSQAHNSSSGGWTSSFQGPWSTRGPGRRLGGN